MIAFPSVLSAVGSLVTLAPTWDLADSIWPNNVSKIFDGIGEEITLGLLDIEAVLLQAFEDLSKMLLMLSWIFRVNQDISQIKNDTNVQHISEDLIHESLKCYWDIGQSK